MHASSRLDKPIPSSCGTGVRNFVAAVHEHLAQAAMEMIPATSAFNVDPMPILEREVALPTLPDDLWLDDVPLEEELHRLPMSQKGGLVHSMSLLDDAPQDSQKRSREHSLPLSSDQLPSEQKLQTYRHDKPKKCADSLQVSDDDQPEGTPQVKEISKSPTSQKHDRGLSLQLLDDDSPEGIPHEGEFLKFPAWQKHDGGRSYSGILGNYQRQFKIIDSDGSGSMSEQELFEHVKAHIEGHGHQLTEELLALLREEVSQRYEEIGLGLGDCLTSCKWVNYMALRSTAPTYVAAKGVNRKLAASLAYDPALLGRIHTAFQAVDTQCNGYLASSQCRKALHQLQVPPTYMIEMDVNGDSSFDYFEFMNLVLHTMPHKVSLAYYDLSKGFSDWVPAFMLSGHKFEGIWHTGVLAFGEEWWYGAGLFCSPPGSTPFGKPTKVEMLGYTLRTREELSDFCIAELSSVFTKKAYDVFDQNCNNFSNEVVQFLLRGKQIPEDVRMQTTWAKEGSAVQTLRPCLNTWLGGVDEHNSYKNNFQTIDNMSREWRSRLTAGDIVLHRKRYIDRPHVAKIKSAGTVGPANNRKRTATIVMFRPSGAAWAREKLVRDSVRTLGDMWDWQLECQHCVPVTELWPCFSISKVGAKLLNPEQATEGSVSVVLGRAISQPVVPSCTSGHMLIPISTLWFSGAPTCNICKLEVTVKSDQQCPKCDFYMCGSCLRVGRTMKGGGVFIDIMNHELADALLCHPGFLQYKAQCYYDRADYNDDGLGIHEVSLLSARLSAELQVSKESVLSFDERLTDKNQATGKFDLQSFEHLFAATLLLAVGKSHVFQLPRGE